MNEYAPIVASIVGFLVGMVVGWTSRAARDVRDLRKVVMPEDPNPPSMLRRFSRSDIVLGVLVVITLLATISSVRANHHVDQLAECNQRVTAQLVQAANERTQYSDAASDRNLELQRAARDTVNTILDDTGTEADRQARTRAALVRYRDALGAFERIQAKSRDQRRAFPYPTEGDIRDCR